MLCSGDGTFLNLGGHAFYDSLRWQVNQSFKPAVLFELDCLRTAGHAGSPRFTVLDAGKNKVQPAIEFGRFFCRLHHQDLPLELPAIQHFRLKSTDSDPRDTGVGNQRFKKPEIASLARVVSQQLAILRKHLLMR